MVIDKAVANENKTPLIILSDNGWGFVIIK